MEESQYCDSLEINGCNDTESPKQSLSTFGCFSYNLASSSLTFGVFASYGGGLILRFYTSDLLSESSGFTYRIFSNPPAAVVFVVIALLVDDIIRWLGGDQKEGIRPVAEFLRARLPIRPSSNRRRCRPLRTARCLKVCKENRWVCVYIICCLLWFSVENLIN